MAKQTKSKKIATPVKRVVKKREVAPGEHSLQATVHGVDGKSAGKISLPQELFGAKIRKALLTTALRVYAANQREGKAKTKTRGEVEGSTRKIYRQKGTGRARHGAIRAPIFVGGGITFGPQPRDYSLKFSKKMKRMALASALTSQYQKGLIHIVDGLEKLEPKTKLVARALNALRLARPTLVVVTPDARSVVRAGRNIAGVELIAANLLHPYAALSHKTMILTKQSIAVLKETFVKEA